MGLKWREVILERIKRSVDGVPMSVSQKRLLVLGLVIRSQIVDLDVAVFAARGKNPGHVAVVANGENLASMGIQQNRLHTKNEERYQGHTDGSEYCKEQYSIHFQRRDTAHGEGPRTCTAQGRQSRRNEQPRSKRPEGPHTSRWWSSPTL